MTSEDGLNIELRGAEDWRVANQDESWLFAHFEYSRTFLNLGNLFKF